MKELVNKFVELERRLSREKGEFTLFALFLREDSLDKWDLIVAAPWIESDRKAALPYITKKIQTTFHTEELGYLSRVVLIDQSNPALEAINRGMNIRHGVANVQNSDFFGLRIKHAYIITSQVPNINAEVPAT